MQNYIQAPIIDVDYKEYMQHTFPEFVDIVQDRHQLWHFPFFMLRLPERVSKLFNLKDHHFGKHDRFVKKEVVVTHQNNEVYHSEVENEMRRGGSFLTEFITRMTPTETSLTDLVEWTSGKYMAENGVFHYFEDMHFSLMEDIIHSHPKELNPEWNFNNLSSLLKHLVEETDKNGKRISIPGVTTSFTYVAEEGSRSSCHEEDLRLKSSNLLYMGSADKLWIGFFDKDYGKINDKIKAAVATECVNPMIHKNIMLSSDFFINNKYKMVYSIQKPGDIVVTNGFHQVTNTGINVAEAVNFYSYGSLAQASRVKICKCIDLSGYYHRDYTVSNWKNYYEVMLTLEARMAVAANSMVKKGRTSTLKKFDIGNDLKKQFRKLKPAKSQPENPHTVNTDDDNYMDTLNELIDDSINEGKPPDEDFSAELFTDYNYDENDEENDIPFRQLQQEVWDSMDAPRIEFLDENDVTVSNSPRYLITEKAVVEENIDATMGDDDQPQNATVSTQVIERNSAELNAFLQQNRSISGKETKGNTASESITKTVQHTEASHNQNLSSRQTKTSTKTPSNEENNGAPPQKEKKLLKEKTVASQKRRQLNERYSGSRKKARRNHEPKRNRKEHVRTDAAETFKTDLHTVQKRIDRTKQYLEQQSMFVRKDSKFYVKQEQLMEEEALKKSMLKLRDLYNACIEYFDQENVDLNIAAGRNAQEIVRDFVELGDPIKAQRFSECIIATKATNMDFWRQVLSSDEHWIAEFGIDKAFRIPCEEKK